MITTGARRLAAGGHQLSRRRSKMTSAQYVAARERDAIFEKLMEGYKNLLKKLHLNRGAAYFVRRYPRIFSVSGAGDAAAIRLTEEAAEISHEESLAAAGDRAVESLIRLLSLSPSRTVPLRAVFKVWRELGLPDDFEDSVISRNPRVFSVVDNPRERNTHLLQLVGEAPGFTPAVEQWRSEQLARKKDGADEAEIKYGFKQEFPPGMRLRKNFRAAVKEWQRLPYPGPYDGGAAAGGARTKAAPRRLEKRAVAIVHEFLDLTVEKMVEVEKMSQFRRWFCIDLNIRDLFLDHPGIFYLSTKGTGHTVFLREAYSGGRLLNPNPLYEARRKLLHLVLLGKRCGAATAAAAPPPINQDEPT